MIWNPTKQPAMVFLELRQRLPDAGGRRRLWGSAIRHPEPQLIGPGERAKAEVTLDPDIARAKRGEQAEFDLTGYINGKVIGGANFTITKK